LKQHHSTFSSTTTTTNYYYYYYYYYYYRLIHSAAHHGIHINVLGSHLEEEEWSPPPTPFGWMDKLRLLKVIVVDG